MATQQIKATKASLGQEDSEVAFWWNSINNVSRYKKFKRA